MLKQKKLNEIPTGQGFVAFLMVARSETKTTKTGKSFLSLELRDQSTLMPAKVWEKADELGPVIKEGIIVKVAGQMEEFNGAPQIKVDKIRPANENDGVSLLDFLPKSTRPLNEMFDEFNGVLASVTNKYLSALLRKIFNKEGLAKFAQTPAGKAWHHAYLHGLLEHTLEIVKICDLMCLLHPEINRDLLVTGALLHDFGKTEELSSEGYFDYTDKGKLLGHIIIAAMEVDKAASEIPDFPVKIKDQLIHLILSHQGKLEFASPVEPKTLEAIVLYQADELSAKTNAYKYAIEADRNKGTGWTRYLNLANTALYIPENDFPKEKD